MFSRGIPLFKCNQGHCDSLQESKQGNNLLFPTSNCRAKDVSLNWIQHKYNIVQFSSNSVVFFESFEFILNTSLLGDTLVSRAFSSVVLESVG